ncbi:MAG TPA: hypothetical protein VF376_00290 [Thermoanaerobaculia bacterium]
MATPDLTEPRELIALLRDGAAPREVQLFAARGQLPLDREGQIRALIAVLETPDAELSAEAQANFQAIPPEALMRFIEQGEPTGIELDRIARYSQDPFVLEQIIRHKNVADETLETMARVVSGAPQDALIVNQVRLLRQPALIDALFENPELTTDGKRRLLEIREEFFEKEVRRREADRATREQTPEEAFREVEEAAAAGVDLPLPPDAELADSLTTGAAYRRIAVMTVSEKIKLAYSGGKEERRILIGDSNRLVGLSVLKSRGLTVNEIEGFTLMRQLDDEIFRKIASNREWIRHPGIINGLVKNPKVPLALTLPLVKYLPLRELRNVQRDPNLAEGIRTTARKLLTEKRR